MFLVQVAGELQRLKKQVAALLAENEALRNRHRKLRQLDASCAQSGQAAAKGMGKTDNGMYSLPGQWHRNILCTSCNQSLATPHHLAEAVSEGGQQSSAKHFIKASRTRNTLPAPAETLISPLKVCCLESFRRAPGYHSRSSVCS